MTASRFFTAATLAAIICGLAFVAFSYSQAYYRLRLKLTRLEQQYQSKISSLGQRSSLWHGEVVRVDAARGEFVMSTETQILAGKDNVELVIAVTDTTLFIRQHLISKGGAYVGFSETESGSLADIVPGMRIAVSITRDPETLRALAEVVMFGGTL